MASASPLSRAPRRAKVSIGSRVETFGRMEDDSTEPATWSLTIEKAGEPPLKLDGLATAPGWRAVDWVGFVSNAEHPTAVYLNDLRLTNGPWKCQKPSVIGGWARSPRPGPASRFGPPA